MFRATTNEDGIIPGIVTNVGAGATFYKLFENQLGNSGGIAAE